MVLSSEQCCQHCLWCGRPTMPRHFCMVSTGWQLGFTWKSRVPCFAMVLSQSISVYKAGLWYSFNCWLGVKQQVPLHPICLYSTVTTASHDLTPLPLLSCQAHRARLREGEGVIIITTHTQWEYESVRSFLRTTCTQYCMKHSQCVWCHHTLWSKGRMKSINITIK